VIGVSHINEVKISSDGFFKPSLGVLWADARQCARRVLLLRTNLQSPPLPLLVMPATLVDLDSLAEVLTQAFHPPEGMQALFFALRKLGIQEDMRQRLEAKHSHYCCLAGWIGDRLVGTLEISLRRLPGALGRGPQPYISNLAVSPLWRRQGIASQLLTRAEAVVQTWGYHLLYLHVMETNLPACQVYTHLNYRILHASADPWQWLGFPRQLLLCKYLG
jgi:GNAT superfamily N-acetyltransferase